MMTVVAFHAGVLGVIESRLRHPAIDQNRFGDHRRRVRQRLHFVAESAAGEVRARRRAHLPLRFVGIAREEHGPLQFFARAKLLAQLPDLLRNKILNFALPRLSFFQSRVVPILCRQCAQKGPRESDVAVRNFQVGIFRVELERVTRLAIGHDGDALIITALRIGFVAEIAVELPAIDPRNVRREMALMIEAQNVAMFLPIVIGIARFLIIELELRMPSPEGGKHLGVAARRSRQFQNHPLDRVWMPMEVCPFKLHSFSRRSFHDRRVAMTRGAVGTGNQPQ